VTVRAESGLEGPQRRMQQQAERDLARIQADLPDLPHLERVEVRLVKHQEDIAANAPAGHGAPPWAVGTAYPDEGVVVVAMRSRAGDLLDAERTLTHELAHLALGRALGSAPVPRWLTEGFANLYSSEASLARLGTLLGALLGGRIVPLWQLDAAFPAEENEVDLAYAEAYDFVAFMAHRGRYSDESDDGDPSALHRFLQELAAGKEVDAASQTAFGRRFVDLEQEWLQSLRDRFLLLPLAMGGTALWASGGVLLVLGYLRRRRQAKKKLAEWEREEEKSKDEE
jgi:peptidase MA superfamily protein